MPEHSNNDVIDGIHRFAKEEVDPYLGEEEFQLATEVAVARLALDIDGRILEEPEFAEFYSDAKKCFTSLFMAISEYEKGDRYEGGEHKEDARSAFNRLSIRESEEPVFSAWSLCFEEALSSVGTYDDKEHASYLLLLAARIYLDQDTFHSYFKDSGASSKSDDTPGQTLEIPLGGGSRAEDLKKKEEEDERLKKEIAEREKKRQELLEADRRAFDLLRRIHLEYVHSIRHERGIRFYR